MRTLKEEEVYGRDYQDLEDARSRIGEFLEQAYNRQRLHSALSHLTPEKFEQARELLQVQFPCPGEISSHSYPAQEKGCPERRCLTHAPTPFCDGRNPGVRRS
jgi:hypothetical protein